jgi:hypothetical protein
LEETVGGEAWVVEGTGFSDLSRFREGEVARRAAREWRVDSGRGS